MTKFKIINKFLQLFTGVTLIVTGFTGIQKANAVQVTLDNISSTADSEIIFSNGSPSLTDGRETTLWVQAEDFVLNQSSDVKNIKFWTLEPVDAVWDGTINYSFFDNDNNKPETTAFDKGTGDNIQKEATGRTLDIYREFAYSFDLDKPVNLSADKKYWLGLHLSSNFNRQEIYWQATDRGFGVNGMSAYLGDLNDWSRSSTGIERAFELSATSSDASQPVPEPSTMLGYFVAIGIATTLRRKFITKN